MKIAGVQKTSTIDYPGQLTAIVFTQGCNFECPYCHNPNLISSGESRYKEYIEADRFFKFLEKRENILDAVTITGGEPTIQPDLINFCEKIKNRGFKIKLDTNGTFPDKIASLLDNELLNYIALDIKSPLTGDDYKWLTTSPQRMVPEIKKSLSIIIKSGIEHEFRTTVIPGIHNKIEIKQIAKTIADCQKYCLQNFRPRKTYDSKFKDKRRFTEKELDSLQEIANKYIKKVIIRN